MYYNVFQCLFAVNTFRFLSQFSYYKNNYYVETILFHHIGNISFEIL